MNHMEFGTSAIITCPSCCNDVECPMTQEDDAQLFYTGECCKLALSLCVEDKKEES